MHLNCVPGLAFNLPRFNVSSLQNCFYWVLLMLVVVWRNSSFVRSLLLNNSNLPTTKTALLFTSFFSWKNLVLFAYTSLLSISLSYDFKKARLLCVCTFEMEKKVEKEKGDNLRIAFYIYIWQTRLSVDSLYLSLTPTNEAIRQWNVKSKKNITILVLFLLNANNESCKTVSHICSFTYVHYMCKNYMWGIIYIIQYLPLFYYM